MPSFVRRVLVTTGVATLVVAVLIATRDWRAALAFAVASAWGMANLVVWAAGCREILMGGADRGAKLLRLGLVKLALLATGLLMLRLSFPFTKNEAVGVIAGVPMVLVITFLKAMGAKLTGRDLMVTKQPSADGAQVMAGGQV
jgi:hypothetical protein